MPENQRELSRRRVLVWELALDLLRRAHVQQFPGGQLGHDLPSLLILGAVIASRAKNLPATASKIGAYLEYPRETVRRHMDDLVKKGMLVRDGHGYTPTEKSASTRHIAALAESIERTARLLREPPETGTF